LCQHSRSGIAKEKEEKDEELTAETRRRDQKSEEERRQRRQRRRRRAPPRVCRSLRACVSADVRAERVATRAKTAQMVLEAKAEASRTEDIVGGFCKKIF